MAAPLTTRVKRLVIAAGAGAAAMYLFDPETGQRRRGKLREQAEPKLEQVRSLTDRTKGGGSTPSSAPVEVVTTGGVDGGTVTGS